MSVCLTLAYSFCNFIRYNRRSLETILIIMYYVLAFLGVNVSFCLIVRTSARQTFVVRIGSRSIGFEPVILLASKLTTISTLLWRIYISFCASLPIFFYTFHWLFVHLTTIPFIVFFLFALLLF